MNLAMFRSCQLHQLCPQAGYPLRFLSVASLLISATLLGADTTSDWPQFLGPSRDGVYHGSALAAAWPETGPPAVWKREVGAGFSGPVVQGDRLILFHRLGDRATVDCLEATSGRSLWRADYPTDYRDDFGFDAGPRATPAIAHGRVITFGAEGRFRTVGISPPANRSGAWILPRISVRAKVGSGGRVHH